VAHWKNLNTDQLQCFVELLQIINEQVRPWAIHCLLLADDSFFKVEPALPPPENLRHGCLPFDGAENRMPNRALLEINLAVSMKQTCDGKGRKMLPQICRLLDRQLGVALDNHAIEIFFEQRPHPFGQVPNNLGLELLDLVENGKRPVLEDRVCV